MEERKAAALLKAKFEQAGYFIEENYTLDAAGVRFDVDGYDSDHRVGYEYVTREAGDDWDVDGDVIEKLAQARKNGELFIFVIDEQAAPDEATLGKAADAFLKELPASASASQAKKPPPAPKGKPAPPAKKSTAKPPPKPAAKAKKK